MPAQRRLRNPPDDWPWTRAQCPGKSLRQFASEWNVSEDHPWDYREIIYLVSTCYKLSTKETPQTLQQAILYFADEDRCREFMVAYR